MLFALSGCLSLAIAAVLLGFWAEQIVARRGWDTAHALGLTHLMSLGFASSFAIGVSYHLAPRIFGSPRPNQSMGIAVWLCFALSMSAFVGGLLANAHLAAAVAGPLLAAAILGFLGQMTVVVTRGRRRSPTSDFFIVALASLALVALLGSLLAVSLELGFIANPMDVLGAKIVLAVGGWLGMLIVGISYQVIPMFTLSRARQRFARAAFGLMLVSLVAIPLALVAHVPRLGAELSAVPYLAGVTLYLMDVFRFMRGRIHSRLTATSVGHVLGATYLAAGTAAAIPAVGGLLPAPQIAVTGALIGWVPLFIVSSAVRILPFLIWEGRRPGDRPRLPTEVPSALAWWSVGMTAPAWPLLALAFGLDSGAIGFVAAICLFSAAAGLASIGAIALRAG
ncbi:MAG TPA: hypothetical protein DEV93_20990 [Chloroflexi bacterium]|nr:hypothetical protein [Chloroflexota bacterium]